MYRGVEGYGEWKMFRGREKKSERQIDRQRKRERRRGREKEGDRQIDNRSNIQYASNEVDPDSKEQRQTEGNKVITVYEDAKMMRQ